MREGVLLKAIEAGFLTLGSSYSPTPSQRLTRQWLLRLAFVPDYSGASVRELHPLPACYTSIALADRITSQNISPEAVDVKAILRGLCNSWRGDTGQGSLRWASKGTGEAWCTRVAGLFLWTVTDDRVGAHLDAGVHLQRSQRFARGRWSWVNGAGSSPMSYDSPQLS